VESARTSQQVNRKGVCDKYKKEYARDGMDDGSGSEKKWLGGAIHQARKHMVGQKYLKF